MNSEPIRAALIKQWTNWNGLQNVMKINNLQRKFKLQRNKNVVISCQVMHFTSQWMKQFQVYSMCKDL